MRPMIPVLLVCGLACAGAGGVATPPPTPTPPASPAAPSLPVIPALAPGEISLGGMDLAWDEVQLKDGKWVRWRPCEANPITFLIDPAARKVTYDVGQEVVEYTLVSGILVDDVVTLNTTVNDSPVTLTLTFDGTGRAALKDEMGTRTMAARSQRKSYPERSETPCPEM